MKELSPITYLEAANKGCVFCNPCPSLHFFSSTHFNVLYDPFALIPGHLLIVSKEHIPSLGSLPLPLFKEFQQVMDRVKSQLENCFGSAIVYEHGRVGHCFSHAVDSRSCLHFHQHLLPVDVDIHVQLEPKFRGYEVQDEKEIPGLMEKYGDYLYFENSVGERKFYAADSESVPSHFLRTLIATELGVATKKNWEKYQDCECFLKGKEILEERENLVTPKKRHRIKAAKH